MVKRVQKWQIKKIDKNFILNNKKKNNVKIYVGNLCLIGWVKAGLLNIKLYKMKTKFFIQTHCLLGLFVIGCTITKSDLEKTFFELC